MLATPRGRLTELYVADWTPARGEGLELKDTEFAAPPFLDSVIVREAPEVARASVSPTVPPMT